MEATDCAGAAKWTGGQSMWCIRWRDGRVGFVGGSVWVCGERLHDWEFLGLILEVGSHQLVLFGACGGESGRRGDEAGGCSLLCIAWMMVRTMSSYPRNCALTVSSHSVGEGRGADSEEEAVVGRAGSTSMRVAAVMANTVRGGWDGWMWRTA